MHEIHVIREKRRMGHPEAAKVARRAARFALRAERIKEDCKMYIMLTDSERIRTVNREQRGIDAVTDVLSFPLNELTAGAFDPGVCDTDYDTGALLLGDILVNVERCEAQGEEYGHGFVHELSYLVVHSTLHLLGYDHMDEGEQKRQMRSREKVVMDMLKLE